MCAEGCEFKRFSAAIGAARDGDVIRLAPGTYFECVNNISTSVAIVGDIAADGTRATFTQPCAGKAALNFSSEYFRLEGIQIQDIAVSDRNGACVRLQPGRDASQVAHLLNVVCQRSENGVLGNVGPAGALIVERSLFAQNGRNGQAHGIYLNTGSELVLRNSIIRSSRDGGHSLKSGAQRTFVLSSVIAALEGDNSRAIDLFGGGLLYVEDSVLQQGPNSQNHDLVGLAHETRRLNFGVSHATYIRDSWLIFDYSGGCCRWAFSGRQTGEILLANNRLIGIGKGKIEGIQEQDTLHFDSRRKAGLAPYDGTLGSLPRPLGWGAEGIR